MIKKRIYLLTIVLLLFSTLVFSQSLEEFKKRVTEFTLDNGMKFIILERHETPVISFLTYADVGSVDEKKGITGISHLLEHMAFKGTTTVGTKDIEAEKEAIKKVDEIYNQILLEKRKGKKADQERLKRLEQDFKKAQEEARKYVVSNEFGQIVEQAGGVGLNAFTGWDQTCYIYNFPSNKFELWMSLESDRYLNPVFREFFKERDVVMEERRMRTESQPIGKLLEEFIDAAYKAHPYEEPPLGHMSDLKVMTRKDVERYFKEHYMPSNLTAAIVGDVDPREVKKMAEIYFGRIPSGPKPKPVQTVEPPQLGEHRVEVEDKSQPILLIGYHKPDINHPDNAVYNTISDIIGMGRTSRLYKSLVKEKKIAIYTGAFSGLPGEKYPGLFIFFAVPSKDHTSEECEKAIYEEIEKIKTEPVTDEELKGVKTRARAQLIKELRSNFGMALQLATYEVLTGDWRNLFKELDAINKVTAEDIMRVAKDCFKKKNRTVGQIVTISE
ncbi:MAG: M16 family metallopeptidase [Candidatus Aminicenantia bacterium]